MSGQVVSIDTKRKERQIWGNIKQLQASGIDGILPLGDLILRCRYPETYVMGEDEVLMLQKYDLVEPGGGISDTVRKVVLRHTKPNNFLTYGSPNALKVKLVSSLFEEESSD